MNPDRPYNILVLGCQGSGKTTLISNFTRQGFQTITRVTTYGLEVVGENIKVNLIEGKRTEGENYTETLPDIIIILFDLNDEQPSAQINYWLIESKRINQEAHITLIGTHLENPEVRILDTETIAEICLRQEVKLWYHEVGRCDIVTSYDHILLTMLARKVAVEKLKTLKGKGRETFLDLIYRWAFSCKSYNLVNTLLELGFQPTKIVVGEFPNIAGRCLFSHSPPIKFCMVTNKGASGDSSIQPIYTTPVTNGNYIWDSDEMEQPLKTEGCRASYDSRLMIDWTGKKLRFLHPTWFFSHTDLFDYKALSVVKLRKNKLFFIPREIYNIPELTYLDISHNRISLLPGLWILGSKLQVLLANDNNIVKIDLENFGFDEVCFDPTNARDPKSGFVTSGSQDLFGLFGENFFKKCHSKIWMLQLQNNNLLEIQAVLLDCLKFLEYLDISNNPIKTLTGQLSNTLKYLNVDNLPLISPPRYIADLGIAHLRSYLTQLNPVEDNTWKRHRIVVVGLHKSGKTRLVHKLIDKAFAQTGSANQGLQIHEWKVKTKTLHFWKQMDALFEIWDFSGDPIFQPLYNMFLPKSSIHIIVCDITKFLEDIRFQSSVKEPLRVLLMSLQSMSWRKEQSLKCVLVFTHMDEIVKEDEKETKKALVIKSIRKYIKDTNLVLINDMSQTHERSEQSRKNPDGVNLLPTVVDVHFVSSVSGEHMKKLQARLTQDILIKVEQAAYAKSVPEFYFEFEKRIREGRENVKDFQKRKISVHPPFEKFLMLPLVCSDDIYHSLKGARLLKRATGPEYGREAVCDMLTFFHEEGLLYKYVSKDNIWYISFNLQLLGNVLSDILSHSQMGTSDYCGHSPPGVLPLENIAMLFLPPNISISETYREKVAPTEQERCIPEVLEEFLIFLTAHNICTLLSSSHVIIPVGLKPSLPSCIPRTEDGEVGTDAHLIGNKCRRIYKMQFTPLGFWNVLLMRLLVNLLPVTLPGGIELNKLEPFETLPFQSECYKLSTSPENLPKQLRNDVEDITQSFNVKCLPTATLLADGIRFELKEFPTAEIYYWASGVIISSDQGWNLKICACEDTPLQPGGMLTDSQGIQLSLYADKDSLETRLLRLTHDVIIQTIQRYFPGLCFTSDKSMPWVEVYAQVDNQSGLILETESYHPSTLNLKLLSDIVCHSLGEEAQGNQIDLRDVMPDILMRDIPSSFNLTTSQNYTIENEPQVDEVFEEQPKENNCYFQRKLCSKESMDIISTGLGGLEHLSNLETPYKLMMRESRHLVNLSNENVVKFVGVNFHPPMILVSRSNHGSLREYLTKKNSGLNNIETHAVAMQVVSGLFYLEQQNICHTQLTSETVLIYHFDPILIKLSDAGISHYSKTKTLVCTREEQDLLLAHEPSLPILQFGFLLYEISTGLRPFEGVYSLQEVMRLALHSKLDLNIEAHLLYRIKELDDGDTRGSADRKLSTMSALDGRSLKIGHSSAVDSFELKGAEVSACHRLCIQPILDHCLTVKSRIILDLPMLASKLTLCAGEIGWSPLSSDINVQCMITTKNSELYWASGTRGLLVGHINPRNGKCIIRALTKPDKRRQNSEKIQAIGNVTAMEIVKSTNQLWIGVENTNKGALYVYDLPDMDNYYYGQLQDAVLSIMPIDDKWKYIKTLKPEQEGLEVLKYRVLVGLANGNILVFMGIRQGEMVQNPLAGERAALLQENKPCRGIEVTPDGLIWAACGHKMLVINPFTMKEQPKFRGIVHHREKEIKEPYFTSRINHFTAKETVISMALSGPWIWTIARRCSYIWIWEWKSGQLLLTFDLQLLPDIDKKEVSELTAIAPQGNLLWVGTKTGTLLLLDVAMIRSLIPEAEKNRNSANAPESIRFSRRSVFGATLSLPNNSSFEEQKEVPKVTDIVLEESPLIAYQHCSGEKIRSIQPLPPREGSADAEVVCSVEQNETASRVMVWRFQSSAISTRTKLRSTVSSTHRYSYGKNVPRKCSEDRPCLFSQEASPTHATLPFTENTNHTTLSPHNEISECSSEEVRQKKTIEIIKCKSEELECAKLSEENYIELPNGVDSQDENDAAQDNVDVSEGKTDSHFEL